MALLSLFAPSPIRTIPSASESHRTLPCGSRAYQKISLPLSFRAQSNNLAHRRSGIGPVRPSPCPEGWLFSCQAHYDRLSPHASSRGRPPVRAEFEMMTAGVVAREDLSTAKERSVLLVCYYLVLCRDKRARRLRPPAMRRRQPRGAQLRRPALARPGRRHPGVRCRFRAGGGKGSPRESYPGS